MNLLVLGLFGSLNLTTTVDNNVQAILFNEVCQKACHNCYELQYAKSINEALTHVNAIEIDFYDSKNILNKKGAIDKHWYVRHEGWNKEGNNNCCTSDISGQNDLESCLRNVSEWCSANPDNDLITVFLDKKQGWSKDRSPEDLDALILKYFKRDRLFTPDLLRGNNNSPREAATKGEWPVYGNMKGKVMFCLTGGNLRHPNKTLSEYAEQRGNSALVFVCPQVSKLKHITEHPKRFKKDNNQYVALYNINAKDSKLSIHIKEMKFVSRVFNVEKANIDIPTLSKSVNYIAVFKFGDTSFPKVKPFTK